MTNDNRPNTLSARMRRLAFPERDIAYAVARLGEEGDIERVAPVLLERSIREAGFVKRGDWWEPS